MMPIVEVAPAKLNLALHVRRRRADGYHDIETLFAFCRDGDMVTVDDAARDSFAVTGPFAAALAGEGDNLVTRAAQVFAETFGVTRHHEIVLEKNLPVASGIGGGSADAAATLRALARRHGVAPDNGALVRAAAGLGADVPACLAGRTAFGTGRGDDLMPVGGWSGVPVLLVNPLIAVSTAAVFAGWDGVDRGALDPADMAAGRNDLEHPARALVPAIATMLDALAAGAGVRLARMSGSGATCFAIFDSAGARDDARAAIGAAHPDWWTLASTLA